MITWVTADSSLSAILMLYVAGRVVKDRPRSGAAWVSAMITVLLSVPPAIYCVLYLLLPAYGLGPRIEH